MRIEPPLCFGFWRQSRSGGSKLGGYAGRPVSSSAFAFAAGRYRGAGRRKADRFVMAPRNR